MLYSYEKYLCNKYHKNILITEKSIHENICESSINNYISNNSSNLQNNDINKKETYICPIYGDKIKIQEKEEHSENLSYNDFNIINDMGNEEKLNDEGIFVSRNTLSNHNSIELLNENNYFNNINNSFIYDEFNSYSSNLNIKNIDINKIMAKLNVNTINDDNNKLPCKICIICQEEFKKGDNYIFLPCMHFFHENCIKRWIYINNKCPICNYDIN